MKQAFESKLNIFLSEMLNQMGVVSHSEYLNGGRKDVLVFHQGLTIVLEGSYDKQDAENDAKRRIEQLAADVAIAIHYPKTFEQDLSEGEIKAKLRESRLPVRVVVPEDISRSLFRVLYQKEVIASPVEDWYEVDLNLLAILIKEITQFIISEETVNQAQEDVSKLVESFVGHLTYHNESEVIVKNLYHTLYRLYGFSIGDPVQIKEAIFAQATLAILLGGVYYESIRYAYKLDSLETLASQRNAQWALEKACRDILKINYEAIFDLVKEMLKALPPMARLSNELVKLSAEIASKKTLLRRDLAGKVYHRVVGDWALKKGLATYFTQVPSAYLLLYLAKPGLCRIADLACGSGTLLVAAYSACSARYRISLLKSGEDKNPKEIEHVFHEAFVQSCYAFDVLGYASQITALNLALHSPETPIKGLSRIYTMPLGYREEDHSISLGSLELGRISGRLDKIFKQIVRIGVDKKEQDELRKLDKLEPFDLIVMNPPFSRTTGRSGRSGGGLFGFMGATDARNMVLNDYTRMRTEIEESLNQTALKLLKGTKLEILLRDKELRQHKNIWQAGEGLVFVHLADTLLKIGGRLCLVLPKGLLSGVSWFLARTLLAEHYHVEYVIVSYEKGQYNFSESTSLSECMIVAKRVENHPENENTKFIILLKKPRTSVESVALAKRIEAEKGNYVEAGEAKAFIVAANRKELVDNLDNWGRFVFLPNVNILEKITEILDGTVRLDNQKVAIPLVKFSEIVSSIGVDAHRFVDTFRVVAGPVPGAIRMLKGGEEAQRRTMKTSANAYAIPIIERGETIFQKVGGTLLVPDRIRINTAHVISMVADDKLLSNIFYAVRLKDESVERIKALCLWLNTTWGILTILSSREETHGGFIRLKMSQWKLLPVLDINSLAKDKVKALARVFDDYGNKRLLRIPAQYGTTGKIDGLRLKLDCSFLNIMGLQAEEKNLIRLYREISESLVQWIGLK